MGIRTLRLPPLARALVKDALIGSTSPKDQILVALFAVLRKSKDFLGIGRVMAWCL